MAKKLVWVVVFGVTLFGFAGCTHGGGSGVTQRAWNHILWHIQGAYRDFVGLHDDFDKYIFNLDIRDPDRY